MKKRLFTAAAAALLIGGAVSSGGGTDVHATNSDGAPGATTDTTSALVQLTGDPVTTSKNVDRANGKRVNLQGTATKSYRAQLSAQRNDFKKWLQANAPKARVTGEFDISLNAVSVTLNGTQLSKLRTAPMVVTAQYTGLYHPTDDTSSDPDLSLILTGQAWDGGGHAGAGAGVKVAIIDTGIQQDHPCFDDLGDSDGSNNYTNNKVIFAKVFANKAAKYGFDAKAVQDHGTHVAGTVACDYGTIAKVGDVEVGPISGVAPAAKLGSYNVFPGNITDARSEDILNALDAAFADGMDVANLSLGGNAHGIQDLLTTAIDDLDVGGMVIAVAAGNEGPGFSTVGSPGSAERALTAGASSVSHAIAGSVTTDKGDTATSVTGEFGTPVTGTPFTVTVTPVNGTSAVPGVGEGCEPFASPAPDAISVAVIARGTCDFSVKLLNAQNAGFVGAIVINRVAGAPFVMGTGDVPVQPTIPGVMVGLGDAGKLIGATKVTFNPDHYVPNFTAPNVMADFTSEGPTDVDRRIKPDVVAPGVNVLSSVTGGKFAFFNGTSMATPHLAGAAAVVISQHPTWKPAEVRSAIVNTANQSVLVPFYANPQDDPNLIGAGLLNLNAAVNATVLLDKVSVSFGTVPKGSGRTATATVTATTNTSGALSASVVALKGSTVFTASAVGNTITVKSATAKQAPVGPSWATVVISAGGHEVAHFRVYSLVG
jgi:minor extracellular serine protease Vpr